MKGFHGLDARLSFQFPLSAAEAHGKIAVIETRRTSSFSQFREHFDGSRSRCWSSARVGRSIEIKPRLKGRKVKGERGVEGATLDRHFSSFLRKLDLARSLSRDETSSSSRLYRSRLMIERGIYKSFIGDQGDTLVVSDRSNRPEKETTARSSRV